MRIEEANRHLQRADARLVRLPGYRWWAPAGYLVVLMWCTAVAIGRGRR